MPWERKTVDDQRRKFAAQAMLGEKSLSALCREYGISRPTGYKWLERYRNGESMQDRPHTPFRKPFKTSRETELRIMDVRDAHPTWGARKIQRYLLDKGEGQLPAASTIGDILKRNGCISEAASEQHTPWKRFERDRPNALWQMDYKGHFGLGNGTRCHSRFPVEVPACDYPARQRSAPTHCGASALACSPRIRRNLAYPGSP